MRADFKVVLDACVLANFAVSDVLLRLAEKPRLYQPRWSEEILDETYRTQVGPLKWPPELARSFRESLGISFPAAVVSGYEHIIEHCNNETKDRHVLACAVECKAEVILTFNLKDFKEEALGRWNVVANHPQDYLNTLFSMEPAMVLHKLEAIAHKRNSSLEDHLIDLGRYLPRFAHTVLEKISGAE